MILLEEKCYLERSACRYLVQCLLILSTKLEGMARISGGAFIALVIRYQCWWGRQTVLIFRWAQLRLFKIRTGEILMGLLQGSIMTARVVTRQAMWAALMMTCLFQ